MARTTRLQAIEGAELDPVDAGDSPTPRVVPASGGESRLLSLLAISLRQWSARAVIAFASLVHLLMLSSAFVVYLQVIGQPTVLQLIGTGMYSVFILAAVFIMRR